MIHVDVIITAGALLSALVIKAPFAGAVSPANYMGALATSTSGLECGILACYEDTACQACLDAAGEIPVGVCQESDETSTCSEKMEGICCVLEQESVDCVGNGLLAAWLECGAEFDGCDFDVSTDCTAGGGDSSALPGGDDEEDGTSATTSDRSITTVDSSTTVADDASSSSAVCVTEFDTCVADTACKACLVASGEVPEGVCQDSEIDAETATCSDRVEAVCCHYVHETQAVDCADNDLLAAWIECGAEFVGCEFDLSTDCAAGGGGSSTLPGDDDEENDTSATTSNPASTTADTTTATDDTTTTTSDGGITTADSTTATEEVGEPEEVEEEEDEEQADADAADTDADSATPSTMVGVTTAIVLAATVYLALMCA